MRIRFLRLRDNRRSIESDNAMTDGILGTVFGFHLLIVDSLTFVYFAIA